MILWKPFHSIFEVFQRNWNIKTSLIDAFGTFFLLCSVKFLNVSFDLLVPIHVKQLSSTGELTYSRRLFYDASVVYFGERHLPYAITAIVIMVIFILLPALLLFLYPFRTFQKFLNLFPFRWYILHTFMDTIQGCYKDGTEPGSRDCRWFASILLTARFSLFLIGASYLSPQYFFIAAANLLVLSIVYMQVQPFKSSMSHFTATHVVFFLLLALWYVSSLSFEISATQNPLLEKFSTSLSLLASCVPLMHISTIILRWMYSQRTFGIKLYTKYTAWKLGYSTVQ